MSDKKSSKILYLEKILKWMAILILRKYNPRIVGITGSVGKTSAKEAVYAVLSGHFRVRKNEKNYNNEIGIPLTIIGSKSGEGSIFGWLGVFFRWLGALTLPMEYPEVLILEMGADHPGDIKYLTSFIQCEAAIITDISESHLEYFKTLDKVAQEKWTLVENMKEGGLAAVNIDNAKISKLKENHKKEKARFMTFGFSEMAEMKASEVFYNYSAPSPGEKEEIKGLSFKLNYKGTAIPVRLNNILARHSVYAAMAATAIGAEFKLNLVEIAKSLENFYLPAGRMNLISGIKKSSIIDDTYNASPASTLAALSVLDEIHSSRKIAVLGDMLELGDNEKTGHREVVQKFLEIKNGIFFAVGKRMQAAAEELEKHNVDSDRLFTFSNPEEAGRKLDSFIKPGDLILVKGSQGMRMEKIVEEVMAGPERAEELLCRQDAKWRDKPWKEV